MRRIFLAAILLLFAGCGYKSAKAYVDEVVGERLYVQTSLLLRDPQNAVLIKDAINKALQERFGKRLVSYKSADTKIFVDVKRVDFLPLEYDRYGYVIYYRTKVALAFNVVRGKHTQHLVTKGFYDFPIEPNTVITDTLRFIAIKEAANKAIDAFIAKLSFLGAD